MRLRLFLLTKIVRSFVVEKVGEFVDGMESRLRSSILRKGMVMPVRIEEGGIIQDIFDETTEGEE
jgi:hypothetical protein